MDRREFMQSAAGSVAIALLAPNHLIGAGEKVPALASSSAEPKRYLVVREHVAFAPDGTLYVFHPKQHLLEHRGIDGRKARGRIAQLGAKPGELNYPTAIGFDSRGRVYVADRGNHRINVYSAAGRFIYHIDKAGEQRLSYPRGLALDRDGNLYVADSGMNRTHVFGADQKFIRSFEAESDPVKLAASHPSSVAVAPDGRIHVADLTERCIEIYQSDGRLVGRYGTGDGLRAPRSLALRADGTAFVADAVASAVFIFGADGKLTERLTPRVAGGTAVVPHYVALDGNGLPYVTGSPAGKG